VVVPLQSDDAVEQIKARLNLVEFVQRRVPLRKRGREFWGLCPFHQETTPSFKVNEARQSWYCFGCQKGGDIFSFVEDLEKLEFRGALELLADEAGVELHQQSPSDRRRNETRQRIMELNQLAVQYYAFVLESLPAGEAGRELLEKRQVSTEVSQRFGLGYAPGGDNLASFLRKRNRSMEDAKLAGLLRRDGADFFQRRVVVPIKDERGRPVAFTGRTVVDGDPRKYVNTPETPVYQKSRVLFGLDLARTTIEETGQAVLMEGQFDVIVGHQFGVTNAVASSGTALTTEQVTLLRRYTEELVLVFDNDKAGRSASQRVVELAAAERMRTRVVRDLGEAKDPDEFLRGGGSWETALKASRPGFEDWIREEIQGLNPRLPQDMEKAVRRVQAVLDRITDTALWSSNVELATDLLELNPKLETFRRAEVRPPRRGSQPAPEPAPEPPPGLEPSEAGNNLSKRLSYLLQVLAACPEALPAVSAVLDPQDLEEGDREAYLRMFESLSQDGLKGLERDLVNYPAAERQLVHRAWASAPPGAGPAVAEDLARTIRRQADTRRRRAIINDLREAERRGDVERVDELQADLRRLSARE
jgi:DNA primase